MRTKTISPELLAQLLSDKFKTRFWSNVRIAKPNECWLWKLAKASNGYGLLSLKRNRKNRTFLAHRLAWMLHNDRNIPNHKGILHSCIGQRDCCNPAHLRIGTQKENLQEMTDQGRRVATVGEAAHSCKLTNEQVIQIRNLHYQGVGQHTIARMFKVSHPSIFRIVHRQGWKHI